MISIDPQALATLPSETLVSKVALTRFLKRARELVGLTGEVEVLLTSDAELKRLNRAFRNKNKATDILSFPTPPEIAQHHAGDLAISLETAASQAAQFGHTLTEEIRILMLHGLLHLSGLDHEEDKGEMAARESTLRATLKLPASLIARVATTVSANPIRALALSSRPSKTATTVRKRAVSSVKKSKRRSGNTQ